MKKTPIIIICLLVVLGGSIIYCCHSADESGKRYVEMHEAYRARLDSMNSNKYYPEFDYGSYEEARLKLQQDTTMTFQEKLSETIRLNKKYNKLETSNP